MAKLETIEAKFRDDNDNWIKADSTEWERPESIGEMIENFDADEILACFTSAYVIREQRRIVDAKKSELGMSKAKVDPRIKKATPEEQKAMLEWFLSQKAKS